MQVKIFHDINASDLQFNINEFLKTPKVIIFNIFYNTTNNFQNCMIFYDVLTDESIQKAIKEQTSVNPKSRLYQ